MTTYDIFLSYASADRSAVEALARRLRDEGLRVFFDRWELVPGTPWQEVLEKALAHSRTSAVFLGPEGLGPWHSAEMRVALGQRFEKEPKRVIPVLLPGASESAIPSFLAQRARVDLRGGLDDETAYAQLLAGVLGVAPGGEGPETPGVDPPSDEPPSDDPPSNEPPAGNGGEEAPAWWRWVRSHPLGVLGLLVGIAGAVLTALTWFFPRPTIPPDRTSTEPPSMQTPAEPPTRAAAPAIYSLRVQVLDPEGNPVRGSTVRASAGNEPHLLPDGWWQVEVAAAKVPLDGKVTIWAEHRTFEPGRVDIELSDDANPSVEVRLKSPESRIGGTVVDDSNRGVAGARITVRSHGAGDAVTDQDGRFRLTVEAARGQRIRVHVEHSDFPPRDTFCVVGSECAVILESP